MASSIARAAYLAGMFDANISHDFSQNRLRMYRWFRTKQQAQAFCDLVGYGNVIEVREKAKWLIADKYDVRNFLFDIEPYVLIKNRELEIYIGIVSRFPAEPLQPFKDRLKEINIELNKTGKRNVRAKLQRVRRKRIRDRSKAETTV